MTTIQCNYNSVLILRAGQLGALAKPKSRLEGNKCVSNLTNLIRFSNKQYNSMTTIQPWWLSGIMNTL